MVLNAREVVLEMITNILDHGAYANLEAYRDLNRARLSETDRRFAMEITYGTVKRWNTLDWIISGFLTRPLDKVDPLVLNVLRMSTYQLLYMDRVPASAACDEAVKIVKKRKHQGAAGFANGVLRSIARKYSSIADVTYPDVGKDPVGHISLRYSHPSWMVERWLLRYGLEGTAAICRYNNLPPVLSVRVNTLKVSVDDFKHLLSEKDISWKEGKFCPESLVIEDYGKLEQDKSIHGMFITQSEPSMLASRALDPKRGQSVLDACSAPGSKTTHLAQLMGDQGSILAVDIHEHRLQLVKSNCSRLGVTIVDTLLADAREIPLKTNQEYDAVLVDAPCSGTGVLNRRADARWRKTAADVGSMSVLQREILDKVAPLVKSGGRLVYSTCSLEPEENEEVVKALLGNHPQLEVEPFEADIPGRRIPEGDRGLQILPHLDNLDGFFICRFRKT